MVRQLYHYPPTTVKYLVARIAVLTTTSWRGSKVFEAKLLLQSAVTQLLELKPLRISSRSWQELALWYSGRTKWPYWSLG